MQKKFFAQVQDVLVEKKMLVIGGTIVDATIVEAPDSTKNKGHQRDPEMKTTRKNNKYYFGMRQHIGVDPVYGFVHSTVATPANTNKGNIAPLLLRETDTVVYGDAAYLKMERKVTDGIERDYRINRQMGTFVRHYGKSLSYDCEKQLEKRKTHVRQKVEYIFHIIKDLFGWRKLRYKGLHKNDCYANLLLASANLYMVYQLEQNRKNPQPWRSVPKMRKIPQIGPQIWGKPTEMLDFGTVFHSLSFPLRKTALSSAFPRGEGFGCGA